MLDKSIQFDFKSNSFKFKMKQMNDLIKNCEKMSKRQFSFNLYDILNSDCLLQRNKTSKYCKAHKINSTAVVDSQYGSKYVCEHVIRCGFWVDIGFTLLSKLYVIGGC